MADPKLPQNTASNAVPLADSGTGAAGTSDKYAREDHRHPAGAAGPSASNATPLADSGTGATGVSTEYARGDHRHPAGGAGASGRYVHNILLANGAAGSVITFTYISNVSTSYTSAATLAADMRARMTGSSNSYALPASGAYYDGYSQDYTLGIFMYVTAMPNNTLSGSYRLAVGGPGSRGSFVFPADSGINDAVYPI